MKILESMARDGVEQVVALNDPSCGLSGFLVIHDTTRGPAGGDSDLPLPDGRGRPRRRFPTGECDDVQRGGGLPWSIATPNAYWTSCRI